MKVLLFVRLSGDQFDSVRVVHPFLRLASLPANFSTLLVNDIQHTHAQKKGICCMLLPFHLLYIYEVLLVGLVLHEYNNQFCTSTEHRHPNLNVMRPEEKLPVQIGFFNDVVVSDGQLLHGDIRGGSNSIGIEG